jgi:hypothetical protein
LFAGLQRALDKRTRDAVFAADQFDHDIGVAGREADDVVRPGDVTDFGGALFLGVACRHQHAFDFAARARGKLRASRGQDFDHTAADCAQACDRNAQRSRHFADSISCSFKRNERKRLMLRAAWRMRCSFSTNAMRT